MKAKALIRAIIDSIENNGPNPDRGTLYELERAIIKLDAQYNTLLMGVPPVQDGATYTAGELDATKKHLADMRRLVMMENKDGTVD